MSELKSRIILCKNIKMDKSYNNVLSYTEEQMLALCEKNKIAERTDYSFMRPTTNIYVDFTYEQCIQANYIAFQNKDYSNKWFFAWINDVNYISDKNCELTYTVDAWSSWWDKWNQQDCYILRQHVRDDTIGAHTLPENIDVGEVIQGGVIEDISLSEYFYVGVLTSHNPVTNKDFTAPITVYKRNVMAKKLCLFNANPMDNLVNLGLFLLHTNANGHSSDIDSIFFIPSSLINVADLEENTGTTPTLPGLPSGETYTFYTTKNSFQIESFEQEINKPYSYTDYQPKNNKCLCYPYNYLLVSNNIGNQNIFKYENFSTDKAKFKVEMTVAVGCSGRLVPEYYKNMETDDDESLPLPKYPTIAWSTDSYINWLTQNAINVPTQVMSIAGGLGNTAVTGGSITQYNKDNTINQAQTNNAFTGAISTGVNTATSIANLLGQFYTASLLPNTTNGQNTADINFLAKRNTFTFRQMRAKKEYLIMIDNYFTRYGYAYRKIGTPNLTGRSVFNYIEIAGDSNIGYGSVPSNFMETINNACRKGVTIWHNHDNLGNFSLDNPII